MSFRFKRKEDVAKGLRRIYAAELQTAATGLLPPAADEDRDDAIHEARKSIKKARSVLRLIQPELGDAYKTANTRLRGVGRQLSELRDAGAALETVETLEQEYAEDLGKARLTALKTALTRQKSKAEQAGDLRQMFEELAAELQSVAAEADHWEIAGDGFGVIEAGFQKAFRRGRKALDQALTTSSDTDFHEWRKRVKDHWYHVRLVAPCAKQLANYAKLLKQLETWLGDDHNLVVLHVKLRHDPLLRKNAAQAQTAVALAARRRDELRAKAVELGREIYRVKPRKLTGMVQGCWEAW